MLRDDTFRNYDGSQGRKRRKRNRNTESDEEFMEEFSEDLQFIEDSQLHQRRR